MPSVRLSHGRNAVIDIPVGGVIDLVFEFGGTPPFEFTYTRSANLGTAGGTGKRKGLPDLLETRSEKSEDHTMRIPASEEGTYEVVAIKDRYCAFARDDPEGFKLKNSGSQKLLQL